MLKLIQKYTLYAIIKGFLLTWVMLTTLVGTALFVDKLDNFLQADATIEQTATYFLFILPQSTFIVFPIICVIGSLFGVLALSRHNELIAMFASGASLRWILRPAMLLSILVGVGGFFWNEYLGAPLSKIAEKILLTQIEKKKGIFQDYGLLRGANHRFIRYDEFDSDSEVLTNVVLHEMRPDGRGHRLFVKADVARWDPTAFNPETQQNGAWRLDATSADSPNYKVIVSSDWFSQLVPIESGEILPLEETPDDFGAFERLPIEMGYGELKKRIQSLEEVGGSALSLYPDLYFKIAFPANLVALMIIGMVTGASSFLVGREGSARFTYPLSLCLGILGAYYGFAFFCLAIGKMGHLEPLTATWLPNLVFGCIAIFLLLRR